MSRISRAFPVYTALALTLCLAGSTARAAALYQGDTNNMSFTMTDYHIRITADGPIDNVGGVLSDDGAFINPTVTGAGTNDVMIDWFTLDVPPGDSIGFCVRFTVAKKYKVEKSFTAVAGSFDQAALGESLETNGDYALTNAYNDPVNYDDLQYTVQPTGFGGTDEDNAKLMEDVADGLPFNPGWTPLPPGQVAPLADSPTLAATGALPGEFLLSYFRGSFEGSGEVTFTVQEFEQTEAVPMSGRTTLVLLGLGFLAAIVALLVWKRSAPQSG